jgi:putative ABC transport system permease protein
MALGAESRDILKMVLGQGLRTSGWGVMIGLMGAVALARLLQLLVPGIVLFDPALTATVAALMVGIALAASYRPAIRAVHIDPQVALRSE